jgi:hypothetical protein
VVGDEVDDHPHAPVACGPDELHEIPERAEAIIDAVVVGDVVPVVAIRVSGRTASTRGT